MKALKILGLVLLGLPGALFVGGMAAAFIGGFTQGLRGETAPAPTPTTTSTVPLPQPEVKTDAPARLYTNPADDRLSALQRQQFMDGCVAEDSGPAYCGCVVDRLDARYTTGQIMQMGLEYEDTGTIPDAIVDAAVECI